MNTAASYYFSSFPSFSCGLGLGFIFHEVFKVWLDTLGSMERDVFRP